MSEEDGIRITEVRVAETTADDTRGRGFDLAAVVQNDSPQKTYVVVSCVRSIRYEEAVKVLRVGFTAETSSLEGNPHLVLPNTTPVPPGESAQLHYHLPAVLRQLRGTSGPSLEVDEIDISGLTSVAVSVTYGETPYRPRPGQQDDEVAQELSSWGRTVDIVQPR